MKRFINKHLLGIGLLSLLIIGSLAIFLFPWLFTTKHWGITDFKNAGNIADTINGIAGPFIALASAFIIFLAFWAQIESNRFERFETHYYELLHLHKENVEEMSINGKERILQVRGPNPTFDVERITIENRKVFPAMYLEFHYCFVLCQSIYDEMKDQIPEKYSDIDLIQMSYPFFWAGVGQTSDLLTQSLSKHYNGKLINRLKEDLTKLNTEYKALNPPTKIVKDRNGKELSLENLRYRPFSGHLSRLGHYYRHLFQTVKYIITNRKNKIITDDETENYLKTLRAQLSDFEQVMLYYNALSGYGSAWFDDDYFTEYRMVHNMPMDLVTFGCLPHDHPVFKKPYPNRDPYTNSKGKSYFEADE